MWYLCSLAKINMKSLQRKNLIILSVLSFFFCAILTYLVLHTKTFSLDSFVQNKMIAMRHYNLTPFILFITNIASPLVLYMFSIVLYFFLVSLNRIKDSVIFIFSMFVGAVSFSLIKIFTEIERPLNKITGVSGWSFPSGHTTMATIAFLLTLYFFKDKIVSDRHRKIFIGVFSALVVLVAFSRLYLGAHFLSDVLGGLFLGLGIVCISVIFSKS